MVILVITFSSLLSEKVRFSKSTWMCGTQRGEVGMAHLNDELRVAFLENDDLEKAVDLAQTEWDSCLKLVLVGILPFNFKLNHSPSGTSSKSIFLLWLRLESMGMQDQLGTYYLFLCWLCDGNWPANYLTAIKLYLVVMNGVTSWGGPLPKSSTHTDPNIINDAVLFGAALLLVTLRSAKGCTRKGIVPKQLQNMCLPMRRIGSIRGGKLSPWHQWALHVQLNMWVMTWCQGPNRWPHPFGLPNTPEKMIYSRGVFMKAVGP